MLLRQDPVQYGISQEGADLVLNWRDGLGPETGRVLFILLEPELAHLSVGHARHRLLPEAFLGEQLKHTSQRGVRLIQQREQGVSENMFQTRPPGVGPDLLEDIQEAGGGQGTFLWRDAFERVEAESREKSGTLK